MSTGIKHIEFWVSDFKKSDVFYTQIFSILGWEKVSEGSFKVGVTKMYLKQMPEKLERTFGPRHICFWAENREVVNKIGNFLLANRSEIIRGPIEMNGPLYSPGYYTVDFKDPDGYILEVACIE